MISTNLHMLPFSWIYCFLYGHIYGQMIGSAPIASSGLTSVVFSMKFHCTWQNHCPPFSWHWSTLCFRCSQILSFGADSGWKVPLLMLIGQLQDIAEIMMSFQPPCNPRQLTPAPFKYKLFWTEGWSMALIYNLKGGGSSDIKSLGKTYLIGQTSGNWLAWK